MQIIGYQHLDSWKVKMICNSLEQQSLEIVKLCTDHNQMHINIQPTYSIC